MSLHSPLRAGVDPLVDPRDVADLATSLMSPRDRLLVFLVDERLVGSVSIAVDLERESVTELFALVHDATRGSRWRGLVLAERTPRPLDLSDPIVAEVITAPRHGLRLDAFVRFSATSAHDVWPLVGPEATS